MVLLMAFLARVRAHQHRCEDPDRALSLAHEAAKTLPTSIARDVAGVLTLGRDEHGIARAVAVKAALKLKVTLPHRRVGELRDTLAELGEVSLDIDATHGASGASLSGELPERGAVGRRDLQSQATRVLTR